METTESTVTPPLFPHQERMLAFARMMPRCAWWVSMGGGKTRAALELLQGERSKALLLCPLTLINSTWAEERIRWTPSLPFINLAHRQKAKRLEAIGRFRSATAPCLGIINYESFILHDADLTTCGVTRLILDESSRAKAHNSQTSKRAWHLSRSVPKTLLMSGNPAPNSVEEYWAQMRMVDASALGTSWWGFRGKWGYRCGYEQHEWKPYPEKLPELMSIISRHSIRIGKEEMPGLPPQTFITREVELEPEQRRLYDALKRDWIIEHQGEVITAQTVLAEMGRLRQIASGFVYGPGGQALGVGKAKLDALRDVLDEIGTEQVVIFSVWQEEIRQIKGMLGDQAGCVYGETGDMEKTEAIKAFQSGSLRYLVCHPRSGGVGLNLQHASYAVYASLDYSLESWEQSIARIHRQGQTRPCTYTVLLSKNTLDEKVYAALLKKQSVSEALMEMLRREAA